MSSAVGIAEAYAHCEAVTRAQAANFFYGIRLLPGERRRAMSAAYAFARRVDDIGDGTLEREQKLRRLDAEEHALAAVERANPHTSGPVDPVMVALADAYARFSLPVGVLGELIEGVRMDVEEVSYETFEELVLYCRRVAGAIGRVCLAIFGLRDDASASARDAAGLADDLGIALQITNILRDVREDAQNGRVYLPREDLRRFGMISEDVSASGAGIAEQLLSALAPEATGTDSRPGPAPKMPPGQSAATRLTDGVPRPAELVRFEAERAQLWFERGLALTPLLDRRSAACVLAMAGIYRRLLARIEARPEEAAQRRISLPAREKAWVAALGMLRGSA
jgi:15-cis-phytoene synthase